MSSPRITPLALAVFISIAASAVAQPVHHFSFDEESGLTTFGRDCAQGNLLGFDLNDDSQWVEGQAHGALNLGTDGFFDNRVSFTSAATTAGFTVAMWVNPGDQILTPGEYQLLATPGDAVGFTIMHFDNGEVFHDRVLLFWDGNLQNLHVGTTNLEPGEWYHVAITSTGVGGEKLYYVNGELEEQTLFLPAQGGTEGVHPGNRAGWAAGPAFIGALGNGTRGHDSSIDEMQIFDRALDVGEIAALMAESPSLQPTIENIFPLADTSDHAAEEGITFDANAREVGATIEADGVRLVLNGEAVTDGLEVIGAGSSSVEVLYSGLEVNRAYSVRIEVTDSEGARACSEFTFGTIEDVEDGLLHLFALDENTGLVALDSASARNGSLLGFEDDDSQWVQGICDRGVDLGAGEIADNYMEFESREVNAIDNGGFTVSMWLNPGTQILTPGEYQLLSTPGDVVGFTIMNFNGERRHDRVLLFWDGNLPNLHVGSTTLEPGTWYHVAITSTGVGGEKLYYVNGVLEEQVLFLPSQGGIEGSHPGNVDGWLEGIARVGAINAGGRAHDSIIDDVRVYNRALEEDEILDVLNECDPVICNPIALRDLAPADGENFYDAAAGLEFEVGTDNKGASIGAGDVTLILNGVDVSGELALGGNETERVVRYEGLEADQNYVAEISVTDGCSSLQRTVRFSTFSQCETDDDSLIHHWTFDDLSGLASLDCVGGSLGALGGFADDDAHWVEGVIEGALDFGADEVLDNIVEAPLPALDTNETGGYTISMWVKPGQQILTPGEYQLFNAPGGGVGFTIMNFDNGESSHDRVLLFWDGSLPDLHVGVTTLEPDTWYHVAVTSGGPAGDKLYYLNGELENQTLFLPAQGGLEGFHPGNAAGWGVGNASFGAVPGGRYHDSVLDDVRIYNSILDEDQIAEVADVDDPPDEGPLFTRGDVDRDQRLNLTDAIVILNFLFIGGVDPSCRDAADSDDSGTVNLTDGIVLLNFLFTGGGPPAEPMDCGEDPTPDDDLGCEESDPACL